MNPGGRFVWVGVPEAKLSEAVARDLERLSPGGVILFERNVETADRLRELVGEIRKAVPGVLLAVDFEGGRVNRFRKLVGDAVPARDLVDRSPQHAYEAGRWIGHAVRHFDVDVDFAPVVDLDRGRKDNALDDRYFGSTPSRVIEQAGAFLRGLAVAGVRGCLKHFPGLGEATADTHVEGAPIELSRKELDADLEPFRDLADEAGAIMVGHASYPGLDPEDRPATISPPILQDLLRQEMGFDGLAISDDLDMKAFGDGSEVLDRAETSFALGCDVLLVCNDLDKALDVAARLGSPALEARRREATRRLNAYRDDRPGRPRPEPTLAEIREGLESVRMG